MLRGAKQEHHAAAEAEAETAAALGADESRDQWQDLVASPLPDRYCHRNRPFVTVLFGLFKLKMLVVVV